MDVRVGGHTKTQVKKNTYGYFSNKESRAPPEVLDVHPLWWFENGCVPLQSPQYKLPPPRGFDRWWYTWSLQWSCSRLQAFDWLLWRCFSLFGTGDVSCWILLVEFMVWILLDALPFQLILEFWGNHTLLGPWNIAQVSENLKNKIADKKQPK